MPTPTSAVELDAIATKSVCILRYLHLGFFSTVLGVNQEELDTHNSSSAYSLSSESLPSVHTQHLMPETTTDCHQLPSKIPATLSNHMLEITDGENVILLYGICTGLCQ